jgi:hypothetical protein
MTTIYRLSHLDHSVMDAERIVEAMQITAARRDPYYGHGDWTTERLHTLPLHHLFPGFLLEAKYDNRFETDHTVVGSPQMDRTFKGLMHVLVRSNTTGELRTLSGYSNSYYYPTVAPVDCSREAFLVNTANANVHRDHN